MVAWEEIIPLYGAVSDRVALHLAVKQAVKSGSRGLRRCSYYYKGISGKYFQAHVLCCPRGSSQDHKIKDGIPHPSPGRWAYFA